METETTAIAKSEPQTQRGILTREALKAETEQRALLAQYIQAHMKEGTDFGKVPGTQKESLFKPGAEKLVELFRCTPKFALVKSEEDFERGFFNYMFRVRLYQRDSNAVLAEGFGSANSREGRYRWRAAHRKCPQCGNETIIKGKAEYGGGWLCFKKKGGCGAKYGDGDASIESQAEGKVENDDIATMANTILKMAKKRALVDGAIALARCSDMFTQDVEDFADVGHGEPPPPSDEPPHPAGTSNASAKPAGEKRAPSQASAKTAKADDELAIKARALRASKIWNRAKGLKMSGAQFAEWTSHLLGGQKPSKDWTHEDMEVLERDLADLELAQTLQS